MLLLGDYYVIIMLLLCYYYVHRHITSVEHRIVIVVSAQFGESNKVSLCCHSRLSASIIAFILSDLFVTFRKKTTLLFLTL